MRLIRANLNQIFCYSLNSVDTSKINQQFYVMSDFRFYTTHAYMHFFTDNSLLSVILFIFCWSFCILFSCNAYIRFPMHLYINEAGIFAIEKRPTQKMRNGLFSLRDVPLPSQGKTLCGDDEKNFFYSFMCEREGFSKRLYTPCSVQTTRKHAYGQKKEPHAAAISDHAAST